MNSIGYMQTTDAIPPLPQLYVTEFLLINKIKTNLAWKVTSNTS